MSVADQPFVCHSPFDNLRLNGRYWPVKTGLPRATILIVHGSGEHSQRYAHMAQFYNNHRIACVSFDMRGHGLSDGERGFVPHLDALLDDLEYVLNYIRTDLGLRVPLAIYAHGTGSAICLVHHVRRPSRPLDCQAMILSTPSVCLRKRPTQLLLFSSRAFANLSPHFRLPVGGNNTNVYTNDPAIVKAYRNDPLVHDRWPATTCTMFLEMGVIFEETIIHVPCPVLIQHGDADLITPIENIEKWVRKRLRGDVTFELWPGRFHELHNDFGKEQIFIYLLVWLESKIF